MSSDRYKCAKCHYFFHELDMTKVEDGRLMCGDCAAIEYANIDKAKDAVKRWICSQCKYESSWQFARCGSCGCHGSCMDKKLPPPPFEDGMKDGCQCVDCGNYYPLINVHETSNGKLVCKKCFEKYKVAQPNRSLPESDHRIPMPPVKPCRKEPDNSHYTRGGIEPWTYIKANDLNFFEGSAVKYITRWRHKNGIEDLRKARVYIDELIRQEEEK